MKLFDDGGFGYTDAAVELSERIETLLAPVLREYETANPIEVAYLVRVGADIALGKELSRLALTRMGFIESGTKKDPPVC